MQAETKSLYKPNTPKADPAAVTDSMHDHPARYDYVLPFVVSSCLVLPSLIILAATKQTAGFAVLAGIGAYTAIQGVLWLFMLVAVPSGLLYAWRSRYWLGRIAAVLVVIILLACFLYVIAPQG